MNADRGHLIEQPRLNDERLLAFVREAGRCSGRARTAADVIQGVPIYHSLWSVLDGIARDLDRAAKDLTKSA